MPIEPPPLATASGRTLHLAWPDGRRAAFHALWLRDNCPCPECRHASGQRLIDTFAIPPDIGLVAALAGSDGLIEMTWTHGGHTGRFEPDWLWAHAATNEEAGPLWPRTLWNKATFVDGLPQAEYADVRNNAEALRGWLAAISEYGFALLHGVPAEPGMVTRVAELLGHVRETNYGRLFDVRSIVNPNNLAYTGLALGGHTDNPYRDPTPTLQLLHCLQSSTAGGDNTLVDGFQAAEALRQAAPTMFDWLARTPVRFRFQDANTELESEFPILSLNLWGDVAAVRLNNRSHAPLRLLPDEVAPFYDAYRTFAQMLERPEYMIQFKLEAGDLFIVDNLRVLHGRTGFSGGGRRHLQGCYADMDGLRSTLAVLSRG